MLAQRTSRFWIQRSVTTVLGDNGWETLAMKRRQFYWNRAGVAYIHIPKAAGTTYSNALYGKRLGHVRYANIEHWCPKVVERLPIVSVVREPASRLISAYRFIKSGGTSEGVVEDQDIYHEPAFETFESFVFDWLPAVNVEEQDYVFQPQATFLNDDNGRIGSGIRLFTLEHGTPKLVEFLTPFLRSELTSKNVNSKSSGDDDMKKCLRGTEAQAILQDCYGEDYALYEYLKRRDSEGSRA